MVDCQSGSIIDSLTASRPQTQFVSLSHRSQYKRSLAASWPADDISLVPGPDSETVVFVRGGDREGKLFMRSHAALDWPCRQEMRSRNNFLLYPPLRTLSFLTIKPTVIERVGWSGSKCPWKRRFTIQLLKECNFPIRINCQSKKENIGS